MNLNIELKTQLQKLEQKVSPLFTLHQQVEVYIDFIDRKQIKPVINEAEYLKTKTLKTSFTFSFLDSQQPGKFYGDFSS